MDTTKAVEVRQLVESREKQEADIRGPLKINMETVVRGYRVQKVGLGSLLADIHCLGIEVL